jgi:hypothetical protein
LPGPAIGETQSVSILFAVIEKRSGDLIPARVIPSPAMPDFKNSLFETDFRKKFSDITP